jgi:hypothetical protein
LPFITSPAVLVIPIRLTVNPQPIASSVVGRPTALTVLSLPAEVDAADIRSAWRHGPQW